MAFRLRRRIVWDGARETFPADREARFMLAREYRAPWILPARRVDRG